MDKPCENVSKSSRATATVHRGNIEGDERRASLISLLQSLAGEDDSCSGSDFSSGTDSYDLSMGIADSIDMAKCPRISNDDGRGIRLPTLNLIEALINPSFEDEERFLSIGSVDLSMGIQDSLNMTDRLNELKGARRISLIDEGDEGEDEDASPSPSLGGIDQGVGIRDSLTMIEPASGGTRPGSAPVEAPYFPPAVEGEEPSILVELHREGEDEDAGTFEIRVPIHEDGLAYSAVSDLTCSIVSNLASSVHSSGLRMNFASSLTEREDARLTVASRRRTGVRRGWQAEKWMR